MKQSRTPRFLFTTHSSPFLIISSQSHALLGREGARGIAYFLILPPLLEVDLHESGAARRHPISAVGHVLAAALFPGRVEHARANGRHKRRRNDVRRTAVSAGAAWWFRG